MDWAILILKTVFKNIQEVARQTRQSRLFRLRERVKEHQREKKADDPKTS